MKIILSILVVITIIHTQDIDVIGDSITRCGWPTITHNLLKNNGIGFKVRNFGVQGAAVVQNAYKFKDEYSIVLCRGAQYVVILLGAGEWRLFEKQSDAWKDGVWVPEYKALVNKIQLNGSTVVLGLVTYRADGAPDQAIANNNIDEINTKITNIALEYGLDIIDFNSAFGTNPVHFLNDGIHPVYSGKELLGTAGFEYFKDKIPENRNLPNCDPIIVTPPEPEVMNISIILENGSILLNWISQGSATHQRLLRSNLENGNWIYWWKDIDAGQDFYSDSSITAGSTYYYSLESYAGTNLIGKSAVRMIEIPATYLGIEDDYWIIVKDYENQRKTGWFGCSK